ncbi:M48 family metallopeptidase [bacterium]|nr:M48 family metallopeptidase [bacterium]
MAVSDYVFTASNGESIPVHIAARAGIRNITLRPKTRPVREIHMTRPWLVRDVAALRFLESKRAWVERIFDRAPCKGCVHPGMELDLLGRHVTVMHDPIRRGNDYNHDGTILYIGGGADMFERRLREHIKKEFLAEAKNMIRTCPRELWPTRVTVRDTTSRWGSCSSSGTISFCWRLAFAPRDVMRYVVMHEMAHRVHMDHSPAFWKTVSEFYGFGVERAKRWLTQHGGELYKFF